MFVFGLEDGQWAQDGEVGQVGELDQCHGHVVLYIHLVEVDRCRTYSRIFKFYSYSYAYTVNYDDAAEVNRLSCLIRDDAIVIVVLSNRIRLEN